MTKRKTKTTTRRFPWVALANQYARDVAGGKIEACLWVVLACKRHLADLDKEKDRSFPYRFDKEKAERVCKFATLLRHVKGKWAGQPIRLEPWQAFCVVSLFGWIRKIDGRRRFRDAYIEVPRKNGKSVLAAVIALYMFAADGEAGAEVFSGATTEKQAWEVFRPAKQMAERTPGFKEHFGIEVNAQSLTISSNGSRFLPVIGKPGDGASPSCGIVDEYHEHDTSDQFDTFETGMGAREQPLLLVITTAGTNLAGPCKDRHDLVKKVLEGREENNTLFGIIYATDDSDEWTDFSTWKKANPNFGVSVNEDYLEKQYHAAKQEAARQNSLLTKHINKWCNANKAWMNMAAWAKCADRSLSLEAFEGMPCVIALDLSSKVDLSALLLLFWRDGKYFPFSRFYLPRDTVDLPRNKHYQGWEHEDRLVVTPGAVIDYEYIKEDLRQFRARFDCRAVPYDPFQATQLSTELTAEEFPMVELRPTVLNFSEPMKELEKLVLSDRLKHDGNPVLTWNIANVVGHYDAKDNIYPRKDRPENKIDGAVALIMALNLALRIAGKPEEPAPGIAIL